MKAGLRNPKMLGFLFLTCCLTLAFVLACNLANPNEGGGGSGRLEQIVGTAGKMLSGDLYRTADRYFHKGVGHKHESSFESFFQRLDARITPNEHAHLDEDGNIMEIMPWLRFATEMDPQNVEAYLVAAYWFRSEGLLDRAATVLEEARKENPLDYRVYAERGRLYMRMGDSERAATAFRRADNLWPSGMATADRHAKLDLGAILSYRAFLYELEADYAKAVDLLEREHALFPGRTSLADHVASLKSGGYNAEVVRRNWERIVSGKKKLGSARMEHEHHEHEH